MSSTPPPWNPYEGFPRAPTYPHGVPFQYPAMTGHAPEKKSVLPIISLAISVIAGIVVAAGWMFKVGAFSSSTVSRDEFNSLRMESALQGQKVDSTKTTVEKLDIKVDGLGEKFNTLNAVLGSIRLTGDRRRP